MKTVTALLLMPFLLTGQAFNYSAIYTPITSGYALASFYTDTGTPVNYRMFTALSSDGVTWANIPSTQTVYARDPSIMQFSGTWWLIHTLCNGDQSQSNLIGYRSTTSLTSGQWSTADTCLNIATDIPGTTHAWAPEWFIDPNSSGLSSVHVYISVSTAGSLGPFQIYEKHPTAADFSTWSTATALTVTSGTNIIDAFMVWRADTSKYYLWYTSPGGSTLKYSSSSTLSGTYGSQVTDPGGWGSGQEGPCLIQTVAGSPGTWRIYFDESGGGLSAGQIKYSESTDGWTTWSARAAIVTSQQAKQGTVTTYP